MRLVLALAALAAAATTALADAPAVRPSVTLVLKDHHFTPSRVTVPAGQEIEIVLINQDAALEEFDSVDLKVEEDVTPKATIHFFVRALTPGDYQFMGEKHADTAQGVLMAK
jgi:plastocyanin